MNKSKRYKVVKDLSLWGVIDETGTLINEEPMTRKDAKTLCDECNFKDNTHFDEFRAMELRYNE